MPKCFFPLLFLHREKEIYWTLEGKERHQISRTFSLSACMSLPKKNKDKAEVIEQVEL